jgi:hypothetical protein
VKFPVILLLNDLRLNPGKSIQSLAAPDRRVADRFVRSTTRSHWLAHEIIPEKTPVVPESWTKESSPVAPAKAPVPEVTVKTPSGLPWNFSVPWANVMLSALLLQVSVSMLAAVDQVPEAQKVLLVAVNGPLVGGGGPAAQF